MAMPAESIDRAYELGMECANSKVASDHDFSNQGAPIPHHGTCRTQTTFRTGIAFFANNSDVLMGFAAMSILMVMVIPIPAILLDLFLSFQYHLVTDHSSGGHVHP
jgi:hypothetical protein